MWKEQGLVVKPYKKCSLALPLHFNLKNTNVANDMCFKQT
jgi:hypothetical protein